MQDVLDFRYTTLNPHLMTLVTEEKKLFDACSTWFRKYDNLSQKMQGLDRNFVKTQIVYFLV